jgi:hypothetical protein
MRLNKHDKSWLILYLCGLTPFIYLEFFIPHSPRDYTDFETLFLGFLMWSIFTGVFLLFWAVAGIGYYGSKIARNEDDDN